MDMARGDVGRRMWLASFGVAVALGVTNACQVWLARGGRVSFWGSPLLPSQLIPWLAWGAIVPLVMMALSRADAAGRHVRARAVRYAAVGAIAIAVQTTMTALLLGWWWAFPSIVPMDPMWHLRDQLRTRMVVGILVFGLTAAIYQVRSRAAAQHSPAGSVEPVERAPATLAESPAMLSLKVGYRIYLVDPSQVDWVEADRDYVIVHCGSVTHRVRESISALEARLPAHSHVRVSRSAIVNLQAVREIQPWFRGDLAILLKDGARVTTGAKYRERLTRLL